MQSENLQFNCKVFNTSRLCAYGLLSKQKKEIYQQKVWSSQVNVLIKVKSVDYLPPRLAPNDSPRPVYPPYSV